MDDTRFDHITKSLAAAGSRRGVLHFLAALPLAGALLMLLDGEEGSADGSGAGIGGNRNGHRNRTAHRHRKSHESRREKKCQPKSKAKTCADKCGTIRNNCKKRVDCGSCDCESICPVCQICDTETLTCVPNPEVLGESCGDGQVCQADGDCACDGDSCDDGQLCQPDGTCACEGNSCGACRTCDGDGICQECSGCCDEGVCVDACDCGEECCDGVCCDGGEVCQDDTCCARDCTAVECGSGEPETCGVANCGTCAGGETCINNACVAVCGPATCPGCNCVVTPNGTAICLTSVAGACTGLCRDDSDCCPPTRCGASSGCGGQFVCSVWGDVCSS